MAHKQFGQRKEDIAESAEAISFDFADEPDILCRPKVNGKLLIDLIGKVESGSVGRQAEGIVQVFDVAVQVDDGENPEEYTGKRLAHHSVAEMQAAVEDEVIAGVDPTSSLGRLQDVLDDPDTQIELNELAELVGWLVEQYTGRPTVSAGNSRGGGANMRPTSRRARRSQERVTAKETQRSSSASSMEPTLTSL